MQLPEGLRGCSSCGSVFDRSGNPVVRTAKDIGDKIAKSSIADVLKSSIDVALDKKTGLSLEQITMMQAHVAKLLTEAWLVGFKDGLLLGVIYDGKERS